MKFLTIEMIKDISPIWQVIIQDGKMTILEKDKFDSFIRGFRNGEAELVVRKLKRSRSNEQNRYMWGVVIPIIADEMGEVIHEEVHNMLKAIFLKKGVDYKGKRYEVIRSTTDLSTMEMEDYLKKCRLWAGTELGLNIPLPNEVEI